MPVGGKANPLLGKRGRANSVTTWSPLSTENHWRKMSALSLEDLFSQTQRLSTVKYVYVHVTEGEDIGFEGRSYRIAEELLDYQGRKVLYLNSEASGVSFCDRSYAMHLGSINVKGYVVKWKYGTNEKGEALSQIEPITDEGEQREIRKFLKVRYNVSAVRFE